MFQNFDIFPYIIVFIVTVILYVYFTQPSNSPSKENNENDQKIEGYDFNPQNEIILYHASWCSACHEMMSEWDKFAKLKIPNLKITKIRCDGGNETTCFQRNIKGYPSIILYKANGEQVEFEEQRTAQNILNFVQNHLKQ